MFIKIKNLPFFILIISIIIIKLIGIKITYQYSLYFIFVSLIITLNFNIINLEKLFLMFSMITSFIIITNTNDLIIIFLGMEIQSFAFVILLTNKNKIDSIEAGLKYFIINAISSIIFLMGGVFSLLDNPYQPTTTFFNYNQSGLLLIIISILIKLGPAPFHFWVVDIYNSCSWPLFIIFSIIPKLSLIIVLHKLLNFDIYIEIVGIISLILGFIGALNQTKLKRLIAYSSISNLGLIILTLKFNLFGLKEIIYLFIIIYFINFISILIILNFWDKDRNPYIISLNKILILNSTLPISLSLIFISMGGVPPLSGFISKWILTISLINSNLWYQLITVLFVSIFTIIYYLSICYTIFFKSISNYSKWDNLFSPEKTIPYYKISIIGVLVFLSISSILIIESYHILFLILT